MKTPFETLLNQRAHAMQEARCPYNSEELDLLIGATVRQATPVRTLPLHPIHRSWPRRFIPATCVALILFMVTYYLAPASPGPLLLPMSFGGYAETLGNVAMTLNAISNTYLT